MICAMRVYNIMLGTLEPQYPLGWVKNIFIPGNSCHKAYMEMVNSRMKISMNLCKDAEEQDKELNTMVEAFARFAQLAGAEMFENGRRYERIKNNLIVEDVLYPK